MDAIADYRGSTQNKAGSGNLLLQNGITLQTGRKAGKSANLSYVSFTLLAFIS
ncbi:hypothetical protein [Vogesella sp. LIG4]|uniref:hypothetical protein n=1 Tax=Vogesella sp. LIG4 TaxID=1192162 RepID=UPI0012FE04E1|nr:hypothetical protein [Vogesella sp. LIG4]